MKIIRISIIGHDGCCYGDGKGRTYSIEVLLENKKVVPLVYLSTMCIGDMYSNTEQYINRKFTKRREK